MSIALVEEAPAVARRPCRVAESGSASDADEISCDGPIVPATESRTASGKRVAPRRSLGFARIVDDHGDAVLGFLRRLVGDWHTAHDLRQETLVRALVSFRRGGDPARVRPWLYRIALRATVDFWRNRARRHDCRDLRPGADWAADPRPDAAALAADREARERLRRRMFAALGILTPLTRTVLEARYVEGLSVSEIGRRFGIRPVAVRVRLHRAREAVRRTFEEEENGGAPVGGPSPRRSPGEGDARTSDDRRAANGDRDDRRFGR